MVLPEGWESDYDGTRWFYRYKITGLTQYHFPRPGDEFPELVGLGFGALDLAPSHRAPGEHLVAQQSTPNGINNDTNATKLGVDGRKKTTTIDEKDGMGATGYFDPDNFMYFGLNDVSPVGDENNAVKVTPGPTPQPALAELHEESIWSPVGLVAELATSDTIKCAEELAPIELDATQIVLAPLQTNLQQNGPAELPTHRSPVEQKQSDQHPVQVSMQPVEEYPLVSASFAYPPLRTATEPGDKVVGETGSPSLPEQKVLASQRPTEVQADQNKYETWKPGTQGIPNGEPRNSNRKSVALSSISVLQSQNSELGLTEHKRHSLSGPVESSGVTPNHPEVLRPPSGPRIPAAVSTPSPQVEPSPVPAVLQPATAPSRVQSPQDGSQQKPAQSVIPPLPGSGARHESISFNTRPPASDSGSPHVPSVLVPAHGQQSPQASGAQRPIHPHVDNVRPSAHRVNTLPTQLSSQETAPPKISGPGIYVFQEIPSTIEQAHNKPQNSSAVQPDSNSLGALSQEIQQVTEQLHSIMGESLPVIAPLSLSRPQKPGSPDKPTANVGPPEASKPLSSQTSPTLSTPDSAHPPNTNRPPAQPSPQNSVSQPQGHHGRPASTASSIQQANIHQPSYVSRPASFQAPTPSSSTLQHKVLRKPVLPQRPEKVNPASEIHVAYPPGTPSSIGSAGSNFGFQAPPHSIAPQATFGTSSGHQRPPSISGSSQHSTTNRPPIATNSPVLPQRPEHRLNMINQMSTGANPAPNTYQPTATQAAISNQQNTQRPQVAAHINGITAGQIKPHPSQVSSPAPSVASLHRPPSSASSHTYATAQGNSPNHESPQVIQPSPPGAGISKPFPMLPGQVKPLPSQLGSPPIPMTAQSAHTAPAQTQSLPNQTGPITQAAVNRPPQHYVQGHHTPPGSSMPGQPTSGTLHQGQPRPPLHMASAQQHTPTHSPNVPSPSPYLHQSMGQSIQSPSGQSPASLTQGIMAQSQVSQMAQYTNAANQSASGAQQFVSNQPMGQGQQPFQTSGFQSSLSQTFGQGKPFNSTQAAAALTDAGKKMKKWAKKTWQNPAIKQTTAAIYNTSQGKPQAGQPQRPPGLQHAQTAPPQPQNLPGANAMSQYVQAGMQPVGVQTPATANGNASQPQPTMLNQRPPSQFSRPPVGRPSMPQMQQPATLNQPGIPNRPMFQAPPNQPFYQGGPDPYAALGSTIGAGPAGSQQHHTINSEPQHESYDSQNYADQSGQHHTNYSEPHHEAQPEQHHEGQSGQNHTGHPEQSSGAHSEQQYTNQSEQYHEPYSEQNQTNYSEQYQETYSEPYQGTHADQQYPDQNEQQNTTYSEDNRQPHSEQHPTIYSEPPPADSQIMMDNSTSESYFAPQSDTTVINNTIINNVDNTTVTDTTQTNTSYMDNRSNTFTDTSYMDTTTYTDTAYADTTNTNAEAVTYTDTSYVDASYVDASYTDTAYMDGSYVDTTTMVDVNMDVTVDMSMNMNMSETAYMDQNSMTMEESVSVEASYVDASTVDYSGGDWGGGGEW
ncbi:hypothetical protein F4677DRAFT_464868 [Hypoxylon crocopeplum]|nr:hypothetical protein F4677DRAFT_464868 [Hypoxylon crocopeplum]